MNMLSKISLLAAAFVALVACAPPPPDTSAAEAALKGDPANWQERYNSGDADGIAAMYTEDGMILAPGAAAVAGRAAIREFIAADSGRTRSAGLMFKLDPVSDLGVAGDTAWLTGTFSVVDAGGNAVDTGKFMSVYRLVDGKWLIHRDTWNSNTPPAPEPAAAAPEPAPAEEATPAPTG